MNEEFRVFNKTTNEMFYEGWNKDQFFTKADIYRFGEDGITMQHVGVLDCNGKKIFANDYYLTKDGILWRVYIGSHQADGHRSICVSLESVNLTNQRTTYLDIASYSPGKVIGNSLENPHLADEMPKPYFDLVKKDDEVICLDRGKGKISSVLGGTSITVQFASGGYWIYNISGSSSNQSQQTLFYSNDKRFEGLQ